MLLDNEYLQQKVDYSFGDHSGVLGGVPHAFMKKANWDNEEFRKFCAQREIDGKEWKPITLFIDNIRLYQRSIEYSDWLHMKPVSPQDRQWLNQFNNEDLLKLLGTYPFSELKFIIFTAYEDTPLDDFIWERIPENVLAIHSANGVVFGGKVHPFPHGLEREMYRGYDHQKILKEMIETDIDPEKLLFVAHRSDTGNRASIGEIFKDKPWATVTHLPYREYLTEMKKHKFVLCPSGNGIESARNWETLYMKRIPVFKRHPYLEEMFKEFPVLFVDDFEEVTEDLLKANEHLFFKAQDINPDLLDMDKIYDLRCNSNL